MPQTRLASMRVSRSARSRGSSSEPRCIRHRTWPERFSHRAGTRTCLGSTWPDLTANSGWTRPTGPLCACVGGGKCFIDTSPAFGIRLGAHYCCRATNAVCHLAAREGAPLFACIDDFIGWAPGHGLAWSAFHKGRRLLEALGLQESPDKATEPSTTVTWVGVRFDSDKMTMSIPEDKIRAMVRKITVWLQETTIQLRELQKLLGRLFHATKCSVGARLFCNRLLDGLRTAYRQGFTPINIEMRQDLFWLVTFLTYFNGICLIRGPDTHHDITVDACLSGGAAACGMAGCSGFGSRHLSFSVTGTFHNLRHLHS